METKGEAAAIAPEDSRGPGVRRDMAWARAKNTATKSRKMLSTYNVWMGCKKYNREKGGVCDSTGIVQP